MSILFRRFSRTCTACVCYVLIAFFVSGALSAQTPPRVVATTPWTAAFAMAAGVRDVHVLAPYDLRHPPEYELRATDVVRVQGADLLVFGGYEAMMGRLRAAIGGDSPQMLQIPTDHSRATLNSSIMTIAELTGTVDQAEANLAELMAFIDDWRAEIDATGLSNRTVAVHAFQQAIVRELGITPDVLFGPGPLSARQIDEITRLQPALVIDVWHNESATPLRETHPEAVFVSLINFPGRDGTRSLQEVLQHKRAALTEAVGQLR